MTSEVSVDSELVVVTQQITDKKNCQIYQHTSFCYSNQIFGILNLAILTYYLVEKQVREDGQGNRRTKEENSAYDNPKDCNEDDILETGLVWTEMFADHADVLPPGDHHEADEDSVSSEKRGDLDVGEVAKVLEAALEDFRHNIRSEEFPAEERNAGSLRRGKPQCYNEQMRC